MLFKYIMDIEVFGIKFSDFINAFKKSYDLGNGTYDYMSFLKDTDCASYCCMAQIYENPNDVLNYFITPSLTSILVAQPATIVGGKKRKMKGGTQQVYIFVLILFLLGVTSIFAGPKYDELVREFGSDISKWPKEPGQLPDSPSDRFLLFFINIGPSSQSVSKYNADIAKWMSDKNRWEKFVPMQKEYELEYESQQKLMAAEINVEQTKATTELKKTTTAEAQAAALYDTYDKLLELTKENAELREKYGFLKGMAVGGGVVIGLFFYFFNNMYNRLYRNIRIEYRQGNRGYRVDEPDDNDNYNGNVAQITRGINNMQLNNQLVNRNRLTGGKTKRYRKKGTTKKRR